MPCHAGIAAVERLETVQLPRWPGIAAVERRRTAALEAWQSSALLLPWPRVRVVRGQLYCAPGGYYGRLATFQGSALQLLLGRRVAAVPCRPCYQQRQSTLSCLTCVSSWRALRVCGGACALAGHAASRPSSRTFAASPLAAPWIPSRPFSLSSSSHVHLALLLVTSLSFSSSSHVPFCLLLWSRPSSFSVISIPLSTGLCNWACHIPSSLSRPTACPPCCVKLFIISLAC